MEIVIISKIIQRKKTELIKFSSLYTITDIQHDTINLRKFS